jgi:pimeloyl-ACP methyl ester carboxylesterase
VPAARDAVHRQVEVSGGSIHLVEQGEGPLVLLLHGFPESWRSWRHQLPALAAAGYRAVAIDLRGYGDSLVPEPVEEYRMLAHVADNVAVLRALDAPTAAVVGHDWGSPIAAASALMRPDLFTALGLLGVPYAPRSPMRPTEAFAHAGGDDEFYVSYFQHPGQAEAEIEADIRGWLIGFYVALSGESGRRHVDVFTIPPGATMREKLPADAQPPSWLSPEDLDASVRSFERTGVAGALNRYRNVDRDWEDLAAWDGLTLRQPAIYIGGELDASAMWLADAIEAHGTTLPGFAGNHILDGCGHWVQQERPADVNRLLLDWLAGTRA